MIGEECYRELLEIIVHLVIIIFPFKLLFYIVS